MLRVPPSRRMLGNGARDLIPTPYLANVALRTARGLRASRKLGSVEPAPGAINPLGDIIDGISRHGRVAALMMDRRRRACLTMSSYVAISTSGHRDCNFWRWYSDSNCAVEPIITASLGYRFHPEALLHVSAIAGIFEPVAVLQELALAASTRAENRSLFFLAVTILAVGSFKSTTTDF